MNSVAEIRVEELVKKYYSECLSSEEISQIPPKTYVKLLLIKSVRSYVVCGILAAVLYFLLWNISLIGISVRWVGIIFFGGWLIKSALLWIFGLVMFIGNPFFDTKDRVMGTVWKGVELLVSTADVIYSGFFFLLFAREHIDLIKNWGL